MDEALFNHPDVVEAAVFARPSKNYGQCVEAAVMLRQGSTVNEAELLLLCAQQIGSFKKPDRIHFLSELPKGPSGKVQRIELVDICTGLPQDMASARSDEGLA